MLNKIVHDHSEKDHNDRIVDSNRRLLSIVFLFLTSNIEGDIIQPPFSPTISPRRKDNDKTRLTLRDYEDYDGDQNLESMTEKPKKNEFKIENKFFT